MASGKDKGISPGSIPVNLIRQWCFCPRVPYYQELLGPNVSRPRWVRQGSHFHEAESLLWKRRNLSRFSLNEGKTYRNLRLGDEELGLHGIVDMAIETDDAVFPVEFKLRVSGKSRGHLLQLCAYAMLLEKKFDKTSDTGFLIGGGSESGRKRVIEVSVEDERRKDVLRIASDLRKMMHQGRKPDSSASYAQCCTCEYVNHCNDR